MSHMISIGVRELRRDASRWLARVRAGEEFLVTDRGRPVARLAPVGDLGGYEALMKEGGIAPGTGRSMAEVLKDLDVELPAVSGPSVSEALEQMRSEER